MFSLRHNHKGQTPTESAQSRKKRSSRKTSAEKPYLWAWRKVSAAADLGPDAGQSLDSSSLNTTFSRRTNRYRWSVELPWRLLLAERPLDTTFPHPRHPHLPVPASSDSGSSLWRSWRSLERRTAWLTWGHTWKTLVRRRLAGVWNISARCLGPDSLISHLIWVKRLSVKLAAGIP